MATRTKVRLTNEYIAGLFDGEGNVNIYRHEYDAPRKAGYELSIAIHNTHKGIVERLHGEWGGYLQARIRKTDKWKTGYAWKLSSNEAIALLEKIIPFLVIKREQAEVAIEFQKLKQKKRFRFIQNIQEVDDFYEICYQKMRILNKKGSKDYSYHVQRLNEQTLKKEAIVLSALKNAEIHGNDVSALQENARKGGEAVLKKYGKAHYREMRSKVKK